MTPVFSWWSNRGPERSSNSPKVKQLVNQIQASVCLIQPFLIPLLHRLGTSGVPGNKAKWKMKSRARNEVKMVSPKRLGKPLILAQSLEAFENAWILQTRLWDLNWEAPLDLVTLVSLTLSGACAGHHIDVSLLHGLGDEIWTWKMLWKNQALWLSLVIQWLKIYTSNAGTWVWSLVRELDPTCHNKDPVLPNKSIFKKNTATIVYTMQGSVLILR